MQVNGYELLGYKHSVELHKLRMELNVFRKDGQILLGVTTLAHHSSSKIEITKCFVYARGICWGRKHFFLSSSK